MRFRNSIVWLRRDLRLFDNVAIFEAARCSDSVCLAFVLSPPMLRSDRMGAPLVQGFFDALGALRTALRERGSDLALLEGDFSDELLRLSARTGAEAVFYNVDYEPHAVARDEAVSRALRTSGLLVYEMTDHVYFGAREIEREDGSPYRVFAPFKRRWLDRRALSPRLPLPSERAVSHALSKRAHIGQTRDLPKPEDFGHTSSSRYPRVNEAEAQRLLKHFLRRGGGIEFYASQRDIPAVAGTSHLSPQLRAGTIGIRTCFEHAFSLLEERKELRASIERWISELIWREFYQMVLARFPHVVEGSFLAAGDAIPWRDSVRDFEAWCAGRTGYPIVDAAMRQLNTYGWMHNRLRMISASFLTKDLLIDWRKGERYFERRLADADVAQNNGGWQWAASTGTDAVPYFRIFNPVVQSRKFDPQARFIRSMLPELIDVPDRYVHAPWEMPGESGYLSPIVDHAESRLRALKAYSRLARTAGHSAATML